MVTIDVELSEFTRRAGSLLVPHAATRLDRGLEPGEQVVVRDPVRGCLAARVVDIGFELTDTVYHLELGIRLADEETRDRLLERRHVTQQQLLDLLGRLRTGAQSPQAGRRGKRAL